MTAREGHYGSVTNGLSRPPPGEPSRVTRTSVPYVADIAENGAGIQVTNGERHCVLLLVDEPWTKAVASRALGQSGLSTVEATSSDDAVAHVANDGVDLVVLDLTAPALDVRRLCRRVRDVAATMPIIVLAPGGEVERILAGLAVGVDDYVTRPLMPADLVTRAHVALRRSDGERRTKVHAQDLVIDLERGQAMRDGEDLRLTATELRLLTELASQPGVVLTRRMLLPRVWGFQFLGDSRLVDMAVKRLRTKLGDDARSPRYITTVRRLGYRFERTAP